MSVRIGPNDFRSQAHTRGTEGSLKFRVFLLFLASLCLSACGGGSMGSSSTSPPPPVTHTIGGTIAGLTASGLVLQNNLADNLTVAANATTFTFSTPVSNNGAYSVTVLTQ